MAIKHGMQAHLQRHRPSKAVFPAAVAIGLSCLLALSVGCAKDAPDGTVSESNASADDRGATPSVESPQRPSFEGEWRGEVAQDDRKYLLLLSFAGHDELTTDLRLVLANDKSPGGWQEYPGPVCDCKYEVKQSGPNEGELVLRLVSLRIEGREKPLSDKNKAPQNWPYRVQSADAMEITTSSGRTFVMQRE